MISQFTVSGPETSSDVSAESVPFPTFASKVVPAVEESVSCFVPSIVAPKSISPVGPVAVRAVSIPRETFPLYC